MNKAVFIPLVFVSMASYAACRPADVSFVNDPATGGMTNLCVGADTFGMNFVHQANGRDFPDSLGPRFRWGLGSVKVDGRPCAWEKPSGADGGRLVYRPAEGLEVRVERRADGGDLVERYEFANVSSRTLALS